MGRISAPIYFYTLILLFFSHNQVVFSLDNHLLYDLNLPNNKIINVSTIIRNVNKPIGITTGYYRNKPGIFVTSFVTSDVRFIETTTSCEAAGNCQSIVVAGTGYTGYKNGSLEVATFSDPSRLVYIEELNILVITDRANGYIRYIKFDQNYVGTMTKSDGTKISILANTRPDNQPGTDIKYYNNYLYLTDGINVYNLTGSDGQITSFNSIILKKYETLRQWQIKNDYDSSNRKIYITSIAINSNKNVMYVSYTQSRSALVTVPLNCQNSLEISILYSDGILWDSDKLFTIGYPIPRNGNINSAPVTGYSLVTYPMHLYYDRHADILYWTEVYSHLSGGTSVGALGAVALRRLNLITNEIDYYAGDTGTFRPILGRTTGSKDGFCNVAQFSYPMTIAYYGGTGGSSTVGPLIYISDYGNNAIRKISTHVNTPSPTMSPTLSFKPTLQPTISQKPTFTPSRSPTLTPSSIPSTFPSLHPTTAQPTTATPTTVPSPEPTGIPTSSPSISQAPTRSMPPSSAPTELNGDCFELLLYDEFGDGWNGPILYINHSLPKSKPSPVSQDPRKQNSPSSSSSKSQLQQQQQVPHRAYTFLPTLDPSSSSSLPQAHMICASLDDDRYDQRGKYTIEFGTFAYDSLHDIPFHWEVAFQISTKNENFQNVISGDINTKIEIEFTSDGIFKYKSIERPIEETTSCGKCPHPKPPPSPRDQQQQQQKESNETNKQEEEEEEKPKEYSLPITLYDENEDTWFRSSHLHPTRYVITDATKVTIITSGMMCSDGDSTETCIATLSDGDYYFRVGTEWNEEEEEISWSFCGTQGGSREEISFTILNGQCHLGHHVTLQTIITSNEQTIITFESEILIENIFTSELSIADQRILENVLSETLNLPPQSVNIISICETRPGILCDRRNNQPKPNSFHGQSLRQLSQTYAYDIIFLIRVVLEESQGAAGGEGGEGYIGTQHKHIERFIKEMKEKFESSFSQGSLQTNIRSNSGNNERMSGLQYIRMNKLSSFSVTNVNYEYFSRTTSPSMAPYEGNLGMATIVVMNETNQQELLLATPLLFIIGAFIVVLILSIINSSTSTIEGGETTKKKKNTKEQQQQQEEGREQQEQRHQQNENDQEEEDEEGNESIGQENDIFVQVGLQSIPEVVKSQRFVKTITWESERMAISPTKENLTLP